MSKAKMREWEQERIQADVYKNNMKEGNTLSHTKKTWRLFRVTSSILWDALANEQ